MQSVVEKVRKNVIFFLILMTFICAIAEGGRDGRPRVGSGPALGLDGEKQARSHRRVGAKERGALSLSVVTTRSFEALSFAALL